MKRWCVSVVASLVISFTCTLAAQTPSTSTASTPAASAPAASVNSENQIKGAIPVKLEKSIDSKKLKDGDTLTFLTVSSVHSRSGVMIPSGAKVTGHVTEAKARSKGDSDSTLGISFDSVAYAGKTVPMKGTLQAVGPSLGSNAPDVGPAERNVSTNDNNGSIAPATSSMRISGSPSGTPILNSTSQGVLGVKNLEMNSSGVLTSHGKEVKIESGYQILIRAEIDLPH